MKQLIGEQLLKDQKKTQSAQVFAGQNQASLKVLEQELQKALEKNNKFLACSILNTILSRGFDKKI